MFRGSTTYSPVFGCPGQPFSKRPPHLQGDPHFCRFFFAFILLGVCLFWKSAMFANPESAAEVLFSLMYLGSVLKDHLLQILIWIYQRYPKPKWKQWHLPRIQWNRDGYLQENQEGWWPCGAILHFWFCLCNGRAHMQECKVYVGICWNQDAKQRQLCIS